MPYERAKDGYVVSDDPSRLDFDVIHGFLKDAYWCKGIPRDVVERAARNSLTFGLYRPDGTQTGYGRSITDRATYAYLSDVFVVGECRGHGLGQFLVEAMMRHPDHQGLKHMTLATDDAHDLYARFGFKPLDNPRVYMHRLDLQIYSRPAGSASTD